MARPPAANDPFQDTKLPLTTWFAAIYRQTQAKGGISSIELARRLGVRQPTAWLMKHKLMRAMAAREAEKPKLAGRVEKAGCAHFLMPTGAGKRATRRASFR